MVPINLSSVSTSPRLSHTNPCPSHGAHHLTVPLGRNPSATDRTPTRRVPSETLQSWLNISPPRPTSHMLSSPLFSPDAPHLSYSRPFQQLVGSCAGSSPAPSFSERVDSPAFHHTGDADFGPLSAQSPIDTNFYGIRGESEMRGSREFEHSLGRGGSATSAGYNQFDVWSAGIGPLEIFGPSKSRLQVRLKALLLLETLMLVWIRKRKQG